MARDRLKQPDKFPPTDLLFFHNRRLNNRVKLYARLTIQLSFNQTSECCVSRAIERSCNYPPILNVVTGLTFFVRLIFFFQPPKTSRPKRYHQQLTFSNNFLKRYNFTHHIPHALEKTITYTLHYCTLTTFHSEMHNKNGYLVGKMFDKLFLLSCVSKCNSTVGTYQMFHKASKYLACQCFSMANMYLTTHVAGQIY